MGRERGGSGEGERREWGGREEGVGREGGREGGCISDSVPAALAHIFPSNIPSLYSRYCSMYAWTHAIMPHGPPCVVILIVINTSSW